MWEEGGDTHEDISFYPPLGLLKDHFTENNFNILL